MAHADGDNRDGMIERCACGRPLHYPDPYTESLVRAEIARHGPTLTIPTQVGTFVVPVHFAALHGIDEDHLPEQAARYGFPRLIDAPDTEDPFPC